MKKFLLSLVFISVLNCKADPQTCTFTGTPFICDRFSVSVIGTNSNLCNKDAGLITVDIKNTAIFPVSGLSFVVTLTGPQNPPPQVFNFPESSPFLSGQILTVSFPGLPNGTYSVTTQVLDSTGHVVCTFSCTNIVVTNRKCPILPFLCCCR